jgi:hypothetical protein
MRTSIFAAACVCAIAGGAAVAAPPTPGVGPAITAKAPNLVPIASRMQKGVVSVRNTGSAAAGAFKVTVDCNVMGGEGGCADPGERAAAPYEDPAFPNRLTVSVPGLAPGHVFNHKIAFWDGLVWASGNYEFTVVADAGGVVAETNEGDNTGGTVLGVP